METKHTPGPWVKGINTNSKEWMQIFANNKIVAEVKTINKIGFRQKVDFEIEEANAKLITAAPELLEALIVAYSLLMSDKKWHSRVGTDKIRDTIKKVTE